MKKLLILIILLCPLLINAEHPEVLKDRKDRMFKDMNEEQKAALQSFHENRKSMKLKFDEVKLEKDRLDLLLATPDSSEGQIRDQAAKVNSLMSALQKKRINDLLVLKKQLNSDQFSRLIEKMKQKRKEGRHGSFGKSRKGGHSHS